MFLIICAYICMLLILFFQTGDQFVLNICSKFIIIWNKLILILMLKDYYFPISLIFKFMNSYFPFKNRTLT